MSHEDDSLDLGKCRGFGSARALLSAGSLPRRDSHATPQGCEQTGDDRARSALAVGQHFVAASNGEPIQLTQVTRDFIHWINPTTGSTGRMLRAHFLNYFTPDT